MDPRPLPPSIRIEGERVARRGDRAGIPAFGAALGQELAAVGGGDRVPEGAVGREGRAFAFYGAEAEAGFPSRDVAAVFVDRGDHLMALQSGRLAERPTRKPALGQGSLIWRRCGKVVKVDSSPTVVSVPFLPNRAAAT